MVVLSVLLYNYYTTTLQFIPTQGFLCIGVLYTVGMNMRTNADKSGQCPRCAGTLKLTIASKLGNNFGEVWKCGCGLYATVPEEKESPNTK